MIRHAIRNDTKRRPAATAALLAIGLVLSAGTAEAQDSADYVIITTSAITNLSTKLADFVASKQKMGFTTRVVTQGAQEDDYHYLDTPLEARCENVRGWLTNHWESLGIEYVLLIGSSFRTDYYETNHWDAACCLPMKVVQPFDEVSTDMYYAELTGNWDANGNGVCGEWNDTSMGGPLDGIDMLCEVHVGRIPVYETNTTAIAALDSVLDRAIGYSQSTDYTWRQSLLGAGVCWESSDLAGMRLDVSQMIECFRTNYCVPRRWRTTTLYQKGTMLENYHDGWGPYGSSDFDCDYELRAVMYGGQPVGEDVNHLHHHWTNSNYGVVVAGGHGSINSIGSVTRLSLFASNPVFRVYISEGGIFSVDEAALLNGDRPSFFFAMACNVAKPWDGLSPCLCLQLLWGGAIATFGATGSPYATYFLPYTFELQSASDAYVYRILERMVGEGDAIGEAQSWAHEHGGFSWELLSLQTHCVFTIYGDPSLGLYTCGSSLGESPLIWGQ